VEKMWKTPPRPTASPFAKSRGVRDTVWAEQLLPVCPSRTVVDLTRKRSGEKSVYTLDASPFRPVSSSTRIWVAHVYSAIKDGAFLELHPPRTHVPLDPAGSL